MRSQEPAEMEVATIAESLEPCQNYRGQKKMEKEKMKKEDVSLELSLEEISEFRTRLMLDRLEMQTLMHYIRIPLETLKRRYSRATSDMGRLLIKTAIEYKEEAMRNDN